MMSSIEIGINSHLIFSQKPFNTLYCMIIRATISKWLISFNLQDVSILAFLIELLLRGKNRQFVLGKSSHGIFNSYNVLPRILWVWMLSHRFVGVWHQKLFPAEGEENMQNRLILLQRHHIKMLGEKRYWKKRRLPMLNRKRMTVKRERRKLKYLY